ncbi:MAG: hypothetical protein V7605_1461 [Acidimicrobiaceae bacterium]
MAAVAVGALLVGACSSNHSAEKALVKRVSLEASDLPPGWSRVPAPDPVGAEGDESRYAECLGRPDPKTVRTASVASDQFGSGDGTQVVSTVRTMPSEGVAKADSAAQQGDRAVACLRARLRNESGRRSAAGGAPSDVSVVRMPGLAFGDDTTAFRATFTYPPGDTAPKTTSVDVVHVRKGKVEIELSLSGTQQPFPGDLERDLLTKVVGRA